MRWNLSQIEAIKPETERFFGVQAEVRRFDSLLVVNQQRGFTLLELVMTMIIIGIISAVAVPRFFDNNVFQERGAADQIRAALRYGQKIAVAQRRPVNVNISSGANPICNTELDAGGAVNCVISNRVTVTSPALPQTYQFDGLGRLIANAANLPITIGTTNINIAAETGYVF